MATFFCPRETLLVLFLCLLIPAASQALDLSQSRALYTPGLEGMLDRGYQAYGEGQIETGNSLVSQVLELAPFSSTTWSDAIVIAAEYNPLIVLSALDGQSERDIAYARIPANRFEAQERSLIPLPKQFSKDDFLPIKLLHEKRFYEEQKNWRKVAEMLEDLLDRQPRNIRLLMHLGKIYEDADWDSVASDRYEEARKYSVLEDEKFILDYALIRMVLKKGELYKAERMTTKLLESSQRSYDLYMKDHQNIIAGQKQEEEYSRLRERLAVAFNVFAVIKALKKQHIEAVKLIDRSLELAPGNLAVVLNGNAIYQMSHHRSKALARLEKLFTVVQKLKWDIEALEENSSSLGGGDKSRMFAKSSLFVGTELARIGVTLGRVYLNNKSYETALKWFEESVVAAPDDGLPRYYCGVTKESMGNLQGAQVSLRQALDRSEGQTSSEGSCTKESRISLRG